MLVHKDGPACLGLQFLPSGIELSLTYADIAAQVRIDVTAFDKVRQTAWILHDPFWVSAVFASVSRNHAPMPTTI